MLTRTATVVARHAGLVVAVALLLSAADLPPVKVIVCALATPVFFFLFYLMATFASFSSDRAYRVSQAVERGWF